MSSHFYDHESWVEHYRQRRHALNSSNQLLEEPVIQKWLHDLNGKRLLELGCGEALLCNWFRKQGLKDYLGIDSSAYMLQHAHMQHPDEHFVQMKLEDFKANAHSLYDWVLARLVLHYLENLDSLFAHISQALQPQGYFVFSVEHPIITSYRLSHEEAQGKRGWQVDHYFKPGPRIYEWLGGQVQKYHHTLEDYMRALLKNGFQIVDLSECTPDATLPDSYQQKPLYLLIKAQKLGFSATMNP